MSGVFVTGTGTEVGKTIVAAAVARTATGAGLTVRVFKPAVTGIDDPSDDAEGRPPDHELLRLACDSPQTDDEIAPYRYDHAVSPHLAAELAGEQIDREVLLAGARAAGNGADLLVCEGVGGFLVPLRSDYLIRDLAVDLGLPCVVAATPALGTINHSLLTIESIRAAGLEVAALVLTPWPDHPTPLAESNRETIAQLGQVEVLTLAQLHPSHPCSWPALHVPTISSG